MKRNMIEGGRVLGLRQGNPFSEKVMVDELLANFRPLAYE